MKLIWCVPLLVATLSGCMGTEPDKPNPKLSVVGSTGGNFGQTLTNTQKQITFRLTNDGSGFSKVETLTGIAIDLSGTALTRDQNVCVDPLEENQYCEFSVYYSPSLVGSMSGLVSVSSNADSTPSVALSGNAVQTLNPAQGVVKLTGTTPTTFSAAPGSNQTRTYTLTNQGNAADTITIPALAAGVTDWALTNNCQDPVPAQGNCTLVVTFKPPAGSTVSTTLTVNISDPYNQDYGMLKLVLTSTLQ